MHVLRAAPIGLLTHTLRRGQPGLSFFASSRAQFIQLTAGGTLATLLVRLMCVHALLVLVSLAVICATNVTECDH